MQLDRLIEEANRQLTICNACRYCEGYCAVFPALERRIEVVAADVMYLSNLCHDCRACFYACPFTEPHEYAINIPRALADVRQKTYERYGALVAIRRLVAVGRRGNIGVTVIGALVLVGMVIATTGAAQLGLVHEGPGAFYEVLPWLLMVIPGLALGLYVFAALALGALRFVRDTQATPGELLDLPALLTAGWEAITLRWLRGGDEGCHYPTYRTSRSRTFLHGFVAGGFVMAFVSTTVAAFYQDVLGLLPPYELLSIPVITGAIGGVAMILGCTGLLAIKVRSDRQPTREALVEFDVGFLLTIGLSALTGMMLLALRDSAAMPAMLVLHLTVLGTLYLTAPYGKFAHFVYRYAALVRNGVEEARGAALDV